MKLQHHLEDISTVKNAFDIKNFVKIETTLAGEIYWFSSMQRFMFVHTSGCFQYSSSLYGREISHPWEETFDAFYELKTEIDNAILTGNSYTQSVWTSYNPSTSSIKLPEGISVSGPNNSTHNPLFCSCKSPNLVKSNAGGEVFNYCKDCKKEHKVETKSIGKDSEPDGLYFF